jgi:hypothetical protein
MVSDSNAEAGTNELSFDGEAQLARAESRIRFWRSMSSLVLSVLSLCMLLTIIFNGLYRLAVARTLHWPSSLTPVSIDFHEGDPAMQAFTGDLNCQEDASADIECSLIRAFVQGDLRGISRQLGEVDVDSEFHFSTPRLKAALDEQLQDAAIRHDWATCSAAAMVALQVLDKEDSDPTDSAAEDNRLLLLASACQYALPALLNQKEYASLLQRISAGAHLEKAFISELEALPTENPLRPWGDYFSGLVFLRAKNFRAAEVQFVYCINHAQAGVLRELAKLGSARSIFWRQATRASEQGNSGVAERKLALTKLHDLEKNMDRISFRNDVQHYIEALSR